MTRHPRSCPSCSLHNSREAHADDARKNLPVFKVDLSCCDAGVMVAVLCPARRFCACAARARACFLLSFCARGKRKNGLNISLRSCYITPPMESTDQVSVCTLSNFHLVNQLAANPSTARSHARRMRSWPAGCYCDWLIGWCPAAPHVRCSAAAAQCATGAFIAAESHSRQRYAEGGEKV